jgi:osmotically-inducible protein OsmY
MVKINRLMQLAVCVGMLASFTGCAATQKHESTGQYVDDSVITTKVKAAIFKEENLKTLQINVTTKKAVVHLEGTVDSAQNVARAAEVAKRVDGVALVENGLVVKK